MLCLACSLNHRGGEHCTGFYRNEIDLECDTILTHRAGLEAYSFVSTEPGTPDKTLEVAFMNDVVKVAERGGYERAPSSTRMFKLSYFITREKPGQFKLLVQN